LSEITAIEPQKKRADRVSVFIDGEFVVGVGADVAAAAGLFVGMSVDSNDLNTLLRAELARKARERAIRLIQYRDRSVEEVRRRLAGEDFPPDVIDEVMEFLARTELVDDKKFSRDWVEARTAAKPMGKARLARELFARGIDREVVEEATGAIDDGTEYELAMALARKKSAAADLSDRANRDRLASFLARRGFDWDTIRRVLGDLDAD